MIVAPSEFLLAEETVLDICCGLLQTVLGDVISGFLGGHERERGILGSPPVHQTLSRPVGEAPAVGLHLEEPVDSGLEELVHLLDGQAGNEALGGEFPQARQGDDPGAGLLDAAVGILEQIPDAGGEFAPGGTRDGHDGFQGSLSFERVKRENVIWKVDRDIGTPREMPELRPSYQDVLGKDRQGAKDGILERAELAREDEASLAGAVVGFEGNLHRGVCHRGQVGQRLGQFCRDILAFEDVQFRLAGVLRLVACGKREEGGISHRQETWHPRLQEELLGHDHLAFGRAERASLVECHQVDPVGGCGVGKLELDLGLPVLVGHQGRIPVCDRAEILSQRDVGGDRARPAVAAREGMGREEFEQVLGDQGESEVTGENRKREGKVRQGRQSRGHIPRQGEDRLVNHADGHFDLDAFLLIVQKLEEYLLGLRGTSVEGAVPGFSIFPDD